MVVGDSIPPQQLFELGENQNLPGYGYKEFAGNQAAVIRGLVMYPLPFWRSPAADSDDVVLPQRRTDVSFGAQSGWASATTDAARSAIRRLGTAGDSVLSVTTRKRHGPAGVTSNGWLQVVDRFSPAVLRRCLERRRRARDRPPPVMAIRGGAWRRYSEAPSADHLSACFDLRTRR